MIKNEISQELTNVKNIVFDFGNVLVKWDTNEIVKHYVDNENDRIGLEAIIFKSKEWLMLDNGTLSYAEAKEIFKNRLPNHLAEKVDEIFNNWYEYMPINQQICDWIKTLKNNNYKIYALSNTHIEVYEYIKKLEIGKYFDGFLISAIENMMKPDKKIYIRLFEKFNLIPEKCLFIDDSKENIQVAQECGMHGFIFDYNNFEALNQLKEHGIKF